MFLRHDTAFQLAAVTGMTPSGVFYTLGGAWEVILCAAVLVLLLTYRASIWLSLAQAALTIGMLEGAMMSGCRAAQRSPAPSGTTICDHVTGLPIGAVVLTLEVLALCWIIGSWVRNGDAG